MGYRPLEELGLPAAMLRYLTRIEAEPINFAPFVIRRWHQYSNGREYYQNICRIQIAEDGEIKCSDPAFAPTEEEKAELPVSVLRDCLATKPKPIVAMVVDAEWERDQRGIARENFFICVHAVRRDEVI